MPEAQDKTCVICGQDCAGQPRIKNDKGQYAHKACVAKKQAPEPEPLALDDDDGLAMDDLLGDIADAPESPAMRAACPSCGNALLDGAVICMSCGHNTQSGKKLTSKVITPKDPGAATAVAAKAGGVAALPVLWAIGGCIGGAAGAAIWAAIAYFTNFEIGYVAVLVGFLTGVGVHVASMGRGAGVIAGALAALIAIASIGAGKYAAHHLSAQQFIGSGEFAVSPDDIEDDSILARFAAEIALDKTENGEDIDWPNPGMMASVAQWPDDYPENVRIATYAEFDGLNDEQRLDWQKRIASEHNREWDDSISFHDVDDDWLIDSIAMSIVDRYVEEGKPLDWPGGYTALDAAQWPDDYPEEIRTATQARFDAAPPDELDQLRADTARDINEAVGSFATAMADATFKSSFNAFDILWAILAIGAAFTVASGEGFSLTD